MSFSDRVMEAVALEPVPSPTRSLLRALRAGSWADATASVRTAWHLSTVRSWHVAPAARVRAMALVLAVLMAMGAGGALAAGTAVRLVSSLGATAGPRSDLDGLIPPGHPAPTQAPDKEHHSASPKERPSPTESSPAVPSANGGANGSAKPDGPREDRDATDGETGDDASPKAGDGSDGSSPEETGGGDSGDGESSGGDSGSGEAEDSVSQSSPEPTDGDSSGDTPESGDD
jgi:uncharacterized membrane protein YgcG